MNVGAGDKIQSFVREVHTFYYRAILFSLYVSILRQGLDQAGLELPATLLSQLFKCWNYEHVLPCLA